MGWKERIECPVDSDAGYVNDRWTNRDLIPIPVERRTYKIWSFAVSHLVEICSPSSYADLVDLLVRLGSLYQCLHHWFFAFGLWYVPNLRIARTPDADHQD